MEQRHTIIAERSTAANLDEFRRRDADLVNQRLNYLLELNAKSSRDKKFAKTDKEKLEAQLMRRPFDTGKTFSYFGLMLGTLPPAAIFAKFFFDSPNHGADKLWIVGVFLIVNAITAAVGYLTGKFIGRLVKETENYSWTLMLLTLPFIGIFWGVMAGGAGGAIVFLFGAIFGAMFGALVGGAALPLFAVFHRLLKKDDVIEYKHFLPLALGTTLTICAFILGF